MNAPFIGEIKDRKGFENLSSNHLSRIVGTSGTKAFISKCFPDEQLFVVQSNPQYANTVNYLVTGKLAKGWNKHDRNRFLTLVKFYI